MTRNTLILDTSVIISHFLNTKVSYVDNIIKLAIKKQVSLICSSEIFQELQNSISDPRIKNHPSFKSKKVAQFMAWYKYNAQFFVVEDASLVISRDPNDDKFLHLAKQTETQFILSLDKDLLSISNYYNTKIIKPQEFIQNYFKK